MKFSAIFQYSFFQNACIVALLASIICGIIGTYIVSRRIVFISGGITHASFGGIGIGYYLGFEPILGALAFGTLSALGIDLFSKKADIREDSAIAIFWTLGMAVGIIFIHMTPGYAPNLMSYLFGNILTVSTLHIFMMLLLALTVSSFFILFFWTILSVSFDQEFALSNNAPVKVFNAVLICLVAFTIILSIRVVGIILVMSLLTIPQSIANIFTKKFGNMIFISIAFSFAGTFAGLIASYWIPVPSGAAIIFSLILMFLFVRLGAYIMVKRKHK